ncbi:OprD family outer membrane porin [Pseudomonas sp. GTC 16481]|uniref:OprD family outer membrane porin n=1 Tax=Pseudomonas sp. GTC 16481 TaxID=1661061 RepID=UPI0008637C1D|nr:OprD family outer membrane porin [Pseudomonas sp. GTC 16481]
MSVVKGLLYPLPLLIGFACAPSALGAFLKDSKLNLNLRNFYINTDYREGHAGTSKAEEWGQGFRLLYESGYTDGKIGVGVDALGLLGVKLDSGKGRHQGSTTLTSDGDHAADQWSRFGATLKLKASKTDLRVGTLMPKLPVLVFTDTRPLPQTYQGGMVTLRELDDITLTAGKITQVTGVASADRTGMAVAGGRRQSNDFRFAGVDYRTRDNFLLQYYQAALEDYYSQQFLGVSHIWKVTEGRSLKSDLRYFRSRGIGANAAGEPGYQIAGYTPDHRGEIDNDTWSLAFTYAVGRHSFMLGYQSVSDDSDFVHLNQGSLSGDLGARGASTYLIAERLQSYFGRAGQDTQIAQYSYDFAAKGIPGLNVTVAHQDSEGIQSFAGSSLRERETDIILTYAVRSGPLRGLGLGLLYGELNSEVTPDQNQLRLMVSYNVELF